MTDFPFDLPAEELRFEKIPTQIFESPSDASKSVAREIADLIVERQKENKNVVLGLATGSSPITMYNELVRLHQEEGLSFKNVITFNLDEYFPIQPEALQSYVRFMNEYLFKHIDIPKENIHIPDGTIKPEEITNFSRNYEMQIHEAGGLDFQILGIGRTGHIGFNEPGSPINSRTRPVTLDHITRIDAAADFFSEDFVPRKAITMGVGTIMAAKKIIMMAWGEGKSHIIKHTVEGEISDQVPATFLQKHPDVKIILDTAASAQLTRVKNPWLVGTCDWDLKLTRKAVTWLCDKVSKPILKLTDRDYNDNGMSDLVTELGPAYKINLDIFNKLQHTITGWPGGKPNADDTFRPERSEPAKKRVLIFSPHPDDDVISMGGTFIRLVDHGHDVHVAYQTSGNIAVFDEDVVRYADFYNELSDNYGMNSEESKEFYTKVKDSIYNKKPGDVDIPEVRKIKALIRKAESKDAVRNVGISDEKAYFLDMPFYETGLVKKSPLGKEDIDIVVEVLRKVKPHQLYAAGDLSDPHGTHRVCLDAIFKAMEIVKNEDWAKDCWLWLYRGAWQEWDVNEIEMAVPISPDELKRKRKAIFKHQSQKDSAVFPGSDSREFWQRAEDRNRDTAIHYDKLGLAEYEAMEAFVRWEF